jgi:hypothetical protein
VSVLVETFSTGKALRLASERAGRCGEATISVFGVVNDFELQVVLQMMLEKWWSARVLYKDVMAKIRVSRSVYRLDVLCMRCDAMRCELDSIRSTKQQ